MVAKCYHSADIILDQAGEGLVIGGGNAGLQPVTVGGGKQAGVNIEDQFGGVAPLPKDGKAALVAAQQVAGGAFGLLRGLRLLPDGGFGLADGGGLGGVIGGGRARGCPRRGAGRMYGKGTPAPAPKAGRRWRRPEKA